MRRFWDDAARRNAAWYVDTGLDYGNPDMGAFFETGRRIVGVALDQSPVVPARHELAVEIGSGLGRNCLALAERFDRVVGIDIAPEMVRQARELVTEPRCRFDVGDGATLPGVADGSADFVLSFTVFQHIPDAEVILRYLAEAGRVLRPGGVCSFQWNNTPGVARWRLRRLLLSNLQRLGVRKERYRRNDAAFLGTTVPVDRITAALDDAGLEVRGGTGLGTLYAWMYAQKP